ncbi:endonuclease YncB(thermonuclease family) [Bradyrhizobium yuanmingense]|uniref:thermonuclease family protein n=1 Tax=Bradyrhizobium yuanmingense TaxID=108015 RepID=UPI0035188F19
MTMDQERKVIVGMKHRGIMFALIALITPPGFAATLSGAPRILDGNTIEIENTNVRLSGIEAPETDQICLDAQGRKMGLRRSCSRRAHQAFEWANVGLSYQKSR